MDKLDLELYRTMYLIRSAEEAIQRHYMDDGMKTPMHMSMGSEAITAGVCHALGPSDQVVGSYRSHAVYLARTQETDRFFAEMYGKVTGTSKGKAGSMHLVAPEAGLICTSAIVGSQIPVAVGAAFANRAQRNGKVVAVFFGDGAIDEGVFWESLNIACLMGLPVLFVHEDNGYAVHTPGHLRHGYDSIADIAEQFRASVFRSESTDAREIHELSAHALSDIKGSGRPSFLYLRYYRYLEHVGVSEDFKAGYRAREEFTAWERRDPVRLMRERLATSMSEHAVAALEREVDDQVSGSRRAAQAAPLPAAEVAYEDVLA